MDFYYNDLVGVFKEIVLERILAAFHLLLQLHFLESYIKVLICMSLLIMSKYCFPILFG